jgi:hypothetical protein
MRILLDENAPSGLRRILAGHDVRTAPEMGCARYSNGQLLDEAEKGGFEALITGDRSLQFQQNLTGRNIAVTIFSTNAWPIIRTQPQTVQRAVANASPGTFSFATLSPSATIPAPAYPHLLGSAPTNFLAAAKIPAAVNRAGCRASVSLATCSWHPTILLPNCAVTCAR